jgi:hypothetical protein
MSENETSELPPWAESGCGMLGDDVACCPYCVCQSPPSLPKDPQKPYCVENANSPDEDILLKAAKKLHKHMCKCKNIPKGTSEADVGAVVTQTLGVSIASTLVSIEPECYQYQWFVLPLIIGWILLPLYLKQVRIAYLIGIPMAAIAQILTFLHPLAVTTPAWYGFTDPPKHAMFLILVAANFGIMYFSYKAYKLPDIKERRTVIAVSTMAFYYPKLCAILMKEWGKSALKK